MSTHLTRPLLSCRLRDCGTTCYTCHGARLRFCGKAHDEHEHGHCIECGAPDCPVCSGAEAARIHREQQAELDTLDYVADALDDAGDSQGCMEAAAKAKALRLRMEGTR